MKRWTCVLALALAPAGMAGQGSSAASAPKKTTEPFYRKYLVAGDPLDDQIVEQEHRVDASPNDANLRNDLGNLLAARRFPKEAAQQYEIALDLDPKNFISAYNLGLLRETQEKISGAISAYKTSISRKPGFPQSHFRLGRLYEHTNRAEDAVGEYAKAFWIDPRMRDPRRNPLVIDSALIFRASLANYPRDMAVASMGDESAFVEESRFRKLPTDRAISAQEAADQGEPPPRDVGAPMGSGVTAAPARPRPAPASEPPSSFPGGRVRATPGSRVGLPHPNSPQPPPVGMSAPLREQPAGAPPPPTEPVPEPVPTPAPPPSPDDEPS